MQMTDFMDTNLFAPCGMNCLVCYVHLKIKNACSGCLSNDYNKPARCKLCRIKNCAHNKNILYCYECNDFPCKHIKNLEKSYQKRYQVSLLKNSLIVKEKGLDFFYQIEKTNWMCKQCGGIISLHDMECSNCKLKISKPE